MKWVQMKRETNIWTVSFIDGHYRTSVFFFFFPLVPLLGVFPLFIYLFIYIRLSWALRRGQWTLQWSKTVINNKLKSYEYPMVYIMIGTWRMITIAVQKYLELYCINWFIYLFIIIIFWGSILWYSHDGDCWYEGLAKID